MTRTAFADTFYFLALLNRRDAAHGKALQFSRLTGIRFLTTECVLLELADALNKPPLRSEFLAVYNLVRRELAFTIIESEPILLGRGIELFKKYADKEWSLTDCLSFVVMRDAGIQEALTSDRHFEQAGFTALLK